MEVEELSENNTEFPILSCPADIIIRISSCLRISDLFSLSLTCKHLSKFARTELQRRRRALCNGQRLLKMELMPPMGNNGRYGHSICYHAPQNRVYVCGGRTDQGAILNDMSYFDLETQRWEKGIYADTTRFIPSKCLHASLCSYKDTLILFGGYHYDQTPATGLCKIFTLNLTMKRWLVTFCPAIIKNVHGHSAIMHNDGFMVTFGGHTTQNSDEGGNDMYSLDCNTSTMSLVSQNDDRPVKRVFPALAFVDNNNLIMVGGRTSIEGDYSILNDVFMFTFLNEQKTEGVWTLIEVEGRWPTSMPTFAQTGSFIYMVSQPIDTTHVLVDNELICQLYDSGEADRQLERETDRKFYCSNPLSQKRARRRSDHFGITSGYYPSDRLLLPADHYETLTSQQLNEFGLKKQSESLVNDCCEILRDFYAKRHVILSDDDLQCILLWLNMGRHSTKCQKYKVGPYSSAIGVCFTEGGCIYKALKHFYSNGEEFVQQLCAMLYHFTGRTQKGFMNLDYPALNSCNYWSGETNGNVISMTDLLRLQSLLPIHRVFFDTPLTATIYKLDLRNVVQTHKTRLTQDPVRFMSPLFNKYSVMTFTEHGFFLCGGVSGEWQNLVADYRNYSRRPSTETIFIS